LAARASRARPRSTKTRSATPPTRRSEHKNQIGAESFSLVENLDCRIAKAHNALHGHASEVDLEGLQKVQALACAPRRLRFRVGHDLTFVILDGQQFRRHVLQSHSGVGTAGRLGHELGRGIRPSQPLDCKQDLLEPHHGLLG